MLFVLLESGAIVFYAHSDSYTQAKLLGYSSQVAGGVGSFWGGVNSYFGLREENEELLQRIVELEQTVAKYNMVLSDSLIYAAAGRGYKGEEQIYRRARVVSNTINKRNNYLMINRGESSGVSDGMAVVTPQGEMVGYVVNSSRNYSVVMSILNGGFRSSGKLNGDQHAGSLFWNGVDVYRVQMQELSKYANIYIGAKIVSTGFSQIFPEGITIGSVVDARLNQAQTSYDVDIELAADISSLKAVLVIDNSRYGEGRKLLDDIGAYEIKLPSLSRELLYGASGVSAAALDGVDLVGDVEPVSSENGLDVVSEDEQILQALDLLEDGFVPNLQPVN
ncbi:MAG: rod shape-determining protein MreC [Rikenellaceae bacterium]